MRKTLVALSLAAGFLASTAFASPGTTPREVVQGTVTRIVAILSERPKADRAPRGELVEKRRAEMRRVASDIFDCEEMARRALGRHWTARTRQEQTEFIDLFTELL